MPTQLVTGGPNGPLAAETTGDSMNGPLTLSNQSSPPAAAGGGAGTPPDERITAFSATDFARRLTAAPQEGEAGLRSWAASQAVSAAAS